MTEFNKKLLNDYFINQLVKASEMQFTGRIDINNSQEKPWYLYMSLGRLVWASGGLHQRRRWRRLLTKYCPQIAPNIMVKASNKFEAWDYHLLTALVRQHRINSEQAAALISASVHEILFDILQSGSQQIEQRNFLFVNYPKLEIVEKGIQDHSNLDGQQQINENSFQSQVLTHSLEQKSGSYQTIVIKNYLHPRNGVRPSQNAILPPNCILNTKQAIEQAQESWENWQQAGIGQFFPDQSLRILNSEQLQQQTSANVYKNLYSLTDEGRTLRDIATLMKLDLSKLIRSLSPHIRQGVIGLVDIPDLPLVVTSPEQTATSEEPPKSVAVVDSSEQPNVVQPQADLPAKTRFLVAYVEDSPQLCEMMAEIVAQAGLEFICIQDSMMALTTLIEQKPDLIFLDLIMPVVNGYEICAQIRKVSFFQNTPVVILTGNDGIVDRVRAKMVGATDYITKPLKAEKVLAVTRKYLTI